MEMFGLTTLVLACFGIYFFWGTLKKTAHRTTIAVDKTSLIVLDGLHVAETHSSQLAREASVELELKKRNMAAQLNCTVEELDSKLNMSYRA